MAIQNIANGWSVVVMNAPKKECATTCATRIQKIEKQPRRIYVLAMD
jgi:hypothetical protein